MSKKLIIVVTSKNCGHCKKFKTMKNKLESEFDGDFKFYDIDQLKNLPPFLEKYTSWVPNLFLISQKKWQMALKGYKVKPNHDFKILNGVIKKDKVYHCNNYDLLNPNTYKNL